MIRQVVSYDIFTILIVLGLAMVALAKVLFEKRFKDFSYVFINSTYLKVYERDQRFFDLFDGLLFTNLVFGLTTFTHLAINTFSGQNDISLNLLFKLSIGIAAFFTIKTLLERLVGSLFEIDHVLDSYLFQKISYKNFLGLILIPINMLLLYSIEPTKTIIYVAVGLIFLINMVGLVTSYKSNQNLISRDVFYFILYLCALEISPLLILYELITQH